MAGTRLTRLKASTVVASVVRSTARDGGHVGGRPFGVHGRSGAVQVLREGLLIGTQPSVKLREAALEDAMRFQAPSLHRRCMGWLN
jgi:hypothetical protein